ncbi:MAG: UDP-N-acetylglucosamine 2-epimerase (non-hydrolyzing) [Pseudomonadota bacterium]
MKLITVFGTRPEAIKMAPVIKLLAKIPEFEVKVCVTAQHRAMLDQVLSLYNIVPDYDLNIMSTNQTLSSITQLTMQGMENIFKQYSPDWVLVQGDTNTTFAASLAAYYKKIPVAHIEAGLRTQDIYSPWPEEINRQLTGRIAAVHFPPTVGAQQNLLNEGIPEARTLVTGNTVIDALFEAVSYLEANQEVAKTIKKMFPFLDPEKKLLLMTSHRRENFGSSLEQICRAMLRLAKRDDVQIVYPVHLNPNISKPVNELLGGAKNIFLLPPQDYLPFIYLMMQSYLILTDSGGVQEEAPSLGKPVLVVRNTTERPEGVAAGTARLVGTDENNIVRNVEEFMDKNELYEIMRAATNPYGDGKASARIGERLLHESNV